jgi:hypothetical protein
MELAAIVSAIVAIATVVVALLGWLIDRSAEP